MPWIPILIKLLIVIVLSFNSKVFSCEIEGKSVEYRPKFAENFVVYKKNSGFIIDVKHNKKLSRRYVLGDIGKTVCSNFMSISFPVQKYVSFSTTHIPIFEKMNVLSLLVGFSGIKNVSNAEFIKRLEKGKIQNLNYPPSTELLVKMNPNAIFAYWFQSKRSEGLSKLEELSLPLVYIQEHFERGPLARAEWMVFVSYFFEKQSEVKKWFNDIVVDYLSLKEKVSKIKEKPHVFVGVPYRGNWNVPGWESDFSQLINDAGGNYLSIKNSSQSSVQLSFEQVVQLSKKVDLWLVNGPQKSLEELRKVEPRIFQFDSLKRVPKYNYNALLGKNGGNDFWETSLMRPDLLLRDLVRIFHPSVPLQGKLRWYKKLE